MLKFKQGDNPTRSQMFISQNKRILESARDFYNPDTSFMKVEEYDKADLKVLIIFASPSDVKAVSTTKEALNDFVIDICNKARTKEQNLLPQVEGLKTVPEGHERNPLNVFIDFAYVPGLSDMKIYDKNNMPYAIGNITHLDASYFDVVGFSISVLAEVVTAPCILKSFSRCDKPIPMTWSERKDILLGESPLIFCGGITAVCGDIMYGELGDGRQAFMDFTYLGDCTKMDIIFERLILAKNHNQSLELGGESLYPVFNDCDYSGNMIDNQEFIDSLFDMHMVYQPQSYEVRFNDRNQVISNKKINKRAQDFVKPYYPLELDEVLGIGRSIINADGDNVGTTQTQVSEGCSAAGCCSFCAEGNYTGGWVEKSRDRILWEVREAKKYSAGYKYKPYSFNCNYVTDYKGLLYEFMKLYPKVTFINMRMEELGRDTDALKMMKLIGSNRISAPMEGISPRIQNNLLNKCLSEESLRNFMDDMVHMKLTDIKVGGIFTGYETDEDFQWICDFVDSYKQRAKLEGGNFPFRLKVTPLVSYQLTPCEYIERKSAKKSMLGEHWLTDEWYEKFKEHNVFFKVNGFRYSTFIEQCIIDLGRSATKWMYDNIVSKDIPVYSLRSFANEEIVGELKKLVNKDYFFEARDPDHYISLSHRIHIDLMGSYIPRARRLVRAYKNGNIFANEMDIRCLKTYEGAPTKCYKMCVAKEPLRVYKDVELDEEGNLHGEFRELKGCERCPTNEHRKQRLSRPTPQSKNSDDILAAPRMKAVQKVRFVLSRNEEHSVLNPNNTAHTFIAKFLQKSEELLDMYHSMDSHNFFWQSDPDLPYEVAGIQIVDVHFTDKRAVDLIEKYFDEVKAEMRSVELISFKEEFMQDKLGVNDYNVYRFETTYPHELFESSCISYKGDIKVKKNDLIETIQDSELKKPVFISRGKVMGYFVLPCRYNPYLYLQGLLKDKKITVNKIRTEFVIKNTMTVRSASGICKCGKEKNVTSMVSGKQLPFGINCLPTALLKVEMSKKK